MSIVLPPWATAGPHNPGKIPIYYIDTHLAYPAWFAELGVADSDVDCYWLEVAYQCIKMDMQAVAGFGVECRFKDQGKRYAQVRHPEGRGAHVATKGKEAREHYQRIRGFVPSAPSNDESPPVVPLEDRPSWIRRLFGSG